MKAALLGHGIVGSGVTKILDENRISDIEIVKILVRRKESLLDERFTLDVEDILNDENIDTIIECLGGEEPAHTYVLKALRQKKNVVSANKKMLAKHLELFEIAAENGVKLLAEASCGGGIPWFVNIRRIRRSDAISSFQGIFNGTTNYILSSLFTQEISFEEALKKAQEAGYAEQDPTDDICAYDSLYKVVLSVVIAYGLFVDYNDIFRFGIENISDEDIIYAKEKGKVVKLLGKSEYKEGRLNARVLPCLIDRSNILANVESNNNCLSFISDHLGEAAFYGQGAGSLPTGQAIIMDLLDLKEGRNDGGHVYRKIKVSDDQEAQFYIRHKDTDLFTEYIAEKISDHSFISKKIDIGKLKELLKTCPDEKCFLMEID